MTDINIRISDETQQAFREAEDIISGKIQAQKYTDVHAMFEEILAEDDQEVL